jgi:hypothetical protein
MENNRKLVRIEEQGARFKEHGYFAAFDWRYELLVDYLKLSPTYQAICKSKGKPIKDAPKDWGKVAKTYADFRDVFAIRESDWFREIGMPLFGLKARQSEAFVVSEESKDDFLAAHEVVKAKHAWEEMARPDTVVLAIPRNQTKQQTLKQVTALIRSMEFASSKELDTKPKYQLLRSKLQKDTIALGVDALKMYRKGIPLWQIGYKLGLSPDSCADIDANKDIGYNKQYLSIATSKLIRKAESIAENAARGLFPTDKPLKAAPTRLARKVGRPKKSK